MHIIGYAFDAAEHCPDCTRLAYYAGRLNPSLESVLAGTCDAVDEHKINENLVDMWGNPVHPIFSTDERPEGGGFCDRCHTKLGE